MYDDKDLQDLKHEYLHQDYPEDLNSHVISCIVNFQESNTVRKINKNMIYINVVLAACLVFGIFSVFKKTNKELLLTEEYQFENGTRVLDESGKFDLHNGEYAVIENEFIISIYPKNKTLTIEDDIFNIHKMEKRIVSLKDIISDNVRSSTDINQYVKEILFDENSKFYIDDEGFYILIGENKYYKVDKNLENQILKEDFK